MLHNKSGKDVFSRPTLSTPIVCLVGCALIRTARVWLVGRGTSDKGVFGRLLTRTARGCLEWAP